MRDAIIICEVCGMQMTEGQEAAQVRCLVIECPLPNAGPAGAAYAKATAKDRKKITGIIIGRPGHEHHKIPDRKGRIHDRLI